MILSLDTSVLVNLLRGDQGTRARFAAAAAETSMVVSSVAYVELALGALLSGDPGKHLEAMRTLLVNMSICDFSHADASTTASIRAGLQRGGGRIGAYDEMIAGQAVARGWTVATANIKDFGRVPDLHVLDWAR